ncbi:MAG: SpoIID/LytB domain-containing protein [Bacteroidales bacterium]|nr:SpoIID/LytB domain-containing protein [Bacteroidales bacterium]
MFSTLQGEYFFRGDTQQINLSPGNMLYFSMAGDQIMVHSRLGHIGVFNKVELVPIKEESLFQVRPLAPKLPARAYCDGIKVQPDFNRLLIINQVDFSHYLAGVVETEAGSSSGQEFYKAHAILCRTYAIKNMDRHIEEGFNLCDGTHCQAYKSYNRHNAAIYDAVKETDHKVVIYSEDSTLITAAFHANSGGATYNSEDVWLEKLGYLRAIADPFSLKGRQASWTKTIDRNNWVQYLQKMV